MTMLLDRTEQRMSPIDVTASLRGETGWIATPVAGWGPIGRTGTVIAAPTAILDIPLPGRPRGDLVLDIRAGLARPIAGQMADIAVSANGQLIGRWQLTRTRSKRLRLPADVAATGNPLRISMAVTAPAGIVEVQELRVREVAILTDYAGHLDACANSLIAGWAKAGDNAAPVHVRRNGVISNSFIPELERPDLPAAGHPLESGFQLTLSPPVSPGERIEVVFGSGAPIRGVRCQG